MKLLDVKSNSYINFNKENNKEYPKFLVGDQVIISNQNIKTFLQKVTLQIDIKKFL